MPERDYVAEITAALQTNDAQRLARIALDLWTIACPTIERRDRDAERKRVRRLRGNPQTSALSADITDVRISLGSSKEILEPKTSIRTAVCPQTEAMLRRHCGHEWPEVEAFLLRREADKEDGWAKEMLRITTGTQWTVADLAQVCRDDAALDRPIGSPFALRRFIQNAHHEQSGALNVGARNTRGNNAGAQMVANIMGPRHD